MVCVQVLHPLHATDEAVVHNSSATHAARATSVMMFQKLVLAASTPRVLLQRIAKYALLLKLRPHQYLIKVLEFLLIVADVEVGVGVMCSELDGGNVIGQCSLLLIIKAPQVHLLAFFPYVCFPSPCPVRARAVQRLKVMSKD